MRVLLKIGLPLIVVLLLVWAATSRLQTDVVVAQATRGPAVDAVTGTVKVYANLDVKIKTEVNGRILEVPVELGQMVKEGDILCRLSSEDVEMQLAQRRIQLQAALERLKLPFTQLIDIQNLQEDVERLKQQVQYGGASQAELERRVRDLEKMQTALRAEEIQRSEQAELLAAQVEYLEFQLERMTIRAPYDGEVVEILKFKGDYVWSGNELVRLVSPGRWVELTLAEEDFFGVQIGQKATLRLASYPHEAIPAEVTGLASTADSEKKTRTAFLAVDAPDSKLIPGFTGEAVLVKNQRENAVIVPRRALIGNRVYVVRNGDVEIREVKPGYLSLNKAEILEGVQEGEWVALEDQSLLRAGDNVNAVEAE